MKKYILMGGVLLFAFAVAPAFADTFNINFESPMYHMSVIDGQDGWSSKGAAGSGCAIYDHAVDSSFSTTGFGTQSLRISNAVASGCFGDQTFSKSLVNEAGETAAVSDGLSGGTRQNHFEVQWDFASTVPGAEQPGLNVVASPDRGDGARMSWIQMKDTPTGLEVNFFDYQSGKPDVGSGVGFVPSNVVSGLDRTKTHNIKVTMDFVDGVQNDVVKVYVDGLLMHVGTSWEDYFREQEHNPTRTVDSILFRTSVAAPNTAGKGFLIDNFSEMSGLPVPTDKDQCKKDGWKNYATPAGDPFKNQGECVSFVNTGKYLVQTLTVDSADVDGADSVALTKDKKYRFEVSGTWTNIGKNVADAEYASLDNWLTHMDGYNIAPYLLGAGEFDLQVNDKFVNWGAYSSSHEYGSTMMGDGNPVNFRVFDGDSTKTPATPDAGWYGDNRGSLTVKIYQMP